MTLVKIKTRHKMFIARCLRWPFVTVRKCLKLNSKVKVERNGVNWLLDLDEGIDLAIYLFGSFEASTTAAFKRLARPGCVVLDIGANIGAHALPLAKLVGEQGKVIAFEPTLYAFEKAAENLRLNPQLSSIVRLEQIVLTSHDDRQVPESLYSSWPLVERENLHAKHCGASESTAGARAASVDEYIESSGITRVDLIKLDVDGYECKVLRGAKRLLSRDKPVMVMELCPYLLDEHGSSLDELVEILRAANYQLFDERNEQPLPLDSSRLQSLVIDGHGFNVLAK